MEGNSNWKPNEQGRDSLANNNANDWRSQLDIRRLVFSSIVEKLKKWFPTESLTEINKVAITFECMIHDMATNKDDYLRKIIAKIRTFDRIFRIWQSNNVQSGSLANGTNNTPDSVAQALNQGQSLLTSMPYTQTLTSQQWLPQNNIQKNPESSGLPTQVSITVSAAQNLNIQMGEGGHLNLREQPLAQQQHPQQQPQSSKYLQNQMDQQLLNGNLRPPYMQQQQPQNRILQQPLDNTQKFQVEGSLPQNRNLADQQNQPYQLQKTPPANPSTPQDSTGKTVNASGDDWQEETYQKIKALKQQYLRVLNTMFQKISDKLREIDSVPQQNMQHGLIEKLRTGKSTLEQVLRFLNVSRSRISEIHRDKFSLCEEQVLRFTKPHPTVTWRRMQQQKQVHLSPSQIHQTALQSQSGHKVHVSQSLNNDQMNSRLMPSHQNKASSSVPGLMTSNIEMPISVESPVCPAQEHPQSTLSPEQNAERPIDRLIKAFQSSSPESLAQSVSEMRSVISLADRLAGSVHSIGGSRAHLPEDLSARTRFRLQQGETHPTKRFKRSISTMPIDIASETVSFKQFSRLESEAYSTASSVSKVNKIEPDCALLQEIREINERLVETVVSICNEDVCPSEVSSGTIVTCSYAPVALSATIQALYKSRHISQIQPLRLVVPTNYPHSPILIEKILFEASVHNYLDLSARTRSRFSLSMKEFSERMSLTEIAQAWDDCARATMAEYVERHRGGTSSSKYGQWVSL